MEDKSTVEFDVLGDALDAEYGDDSAEQIGVEGVEDDTSDETKTDIATDAPADDVGDSPTPAQPTQPADEPVEKPATKDAIKEALREMEFERQNVDMTRRTLRDEIREQYHPGGLQIEPLVDSENRPITGVSDIAGKLINPRTDEVFTWEEAKDWYDSALQEQKDRISSVEQDIDAIAEVNQSLLDGTSRVMDKYGALLNSMPEVAQNALDGFKALMKVDPKTGIITQAPDPVRYYDIVMRPYVEVANQKQLEAQAKAQQEAQEQTRRNADDRADLPIGTDGTSPVKKDALDKAFDEYFKG